MIDGEYGSDRCCIIHGSRNYKNESLILFLWLSGAAAGPVRS